jgi:hypothetical protein
MLAFTRCFGTQKTMVAILLLYGEYAMRVHDLMLTYRTLKEREAARPPEDRDCSQGRGEYGGSDLTNDLAQSDLFEG